MSKFACTFCTSSSSSRPSTSFRTCCALSPSTRTLLDGRMLTSAGAVVARVHDALDLRSLAAAGRAREGAIEVRVGHVHRPRAIDRETEPEITLGTPPTFARREHDLARHLGENDAPLDIRGALLAL